jgi:hypothetical protein
VTPPRFFVHVSAGSIEEMIDGSTQHGALVEARGYRPPSGRGIYGSIEVTPAQGEGAGGEAASS